MSSTQHTVSDFKVFTMIRPSRHACTVYGSRLPHSSFILPISLSFLVLYILALAAPTSATIRQTPLRSLTSISPPSGSNNGSPRGRQASVSEYSPSHPRPNGAALTKPRADLRYRSIYQVLTDRFGLGPELGVGPNGEERIVRCDPDERRYCGGTWKGIEMRLEYIQGMGFDSGMSGWPHEALRYERERRLPKATTIWQGRRPQRRTAPNQASQRCAEVLCWGTSTTRR